MKRVQNLILMITVFSSIIACNSIENEGAINLNNGEKWEVNTEMKPHIEKGDEILRDFISQHDEDYVNLAENLREQNRSLIQSCTMSGESHEELHKWLHPHMKLIDQLSEARDYNEAKGIISDLEKSFETYHNHFQ